VTPDFFVLIKSYFCHMVIEWREATGDRKINLEAVVASKLWLI
jgi:hypothetical protein